MKPYHRAINTAVLIILCLIFSSAVLAQGMTSQDREDVLYVLKKLKDGEQTPVNLADEREYRVYMRHLLQSGVTPAVAPQFHKVVEATRQMHLRMGPPKEKVAGMNATTDAIQPVNVVTQFGLNQPATLVESAALSSVKGGTIVTTLTLCIYDSAGNQLAIPVQNSQYNSGENQGIYFSATAPTIIQTTAKTYYTLYNWSYIDRGGTPHIGNMVVRADLKPSQINNIAPKQTVSHQTPQIIFCEARTGTNCDYGNLPGSQSNLVVPIQGNIVYTGNIDPIQFDTTGQPTNAFCYFFLTLPTGGGGCPPLPGNINFFKDPNTRITGNTLSWDRGPSNPVSFGAACFGLSQNVIYTMLVQVSVGGMPVTASITNAPNVDTTDRSYLKIPSTSFMWSCLAEGSLVLMADGKEKPIQYMEVLERVKADEQGRILTVENTYRGREEPPMVKIKDSNGNSLLMTENHTVPTPDGVLLAKQLKKGHTVYTTKGKAKLVDVSREKYNGYVWNMDVGVREDNVPLRDDNRTFFANNILVGDSRMQNVYFVKHKQKQTTVLEAIPKEWHQDYKNTLKNKKQ